MELLLVLALLLTLGKKGGKSPQELFAPFAQLIGGQDAEKILESDLFKDVRIMGMKPVEIVKAIDELKGLLSLVPNGAQNARGSAAPSPSSEEASSFAAQEKAQDQDFLAPISKIADENIEKMLGKYFS